MNVRVDSARLRGGLQLVSRVFLPRSKARRALTVTNPPSASITLQPSGIGSPTPRIATLPPITPISQAISSLAVTTMPFLMTRSKLKVIGS